MCGCGCVYLSLGTLITYADANRTQTTHAHLPLHNTNTYTHTLASARTHTRTQHTCIRLQPPNIHTHAQVITGNFDGTYDGNNFYLYLGSRPGLISFFSLVSVFHCLLYSALIVCSPPFSFFSLWFSSPRFLHLPLFFFFSCSAFFFFNLLFLPSSICCTLLSFFCLLVALSAMPPRLLLISLTFLVSCTLRRKC